MGMHCEKKLWLRASMGMHCEKKLWLRARMVMLHEKKTGVEGKNCHASCEKNCG